MFGSMMKKSKNLQNLGFIDEKRVKSVLENKSGHINFD